MHLWFHVPFSVQRDAECDMSKLAQKTILDMFPAQKTIFDKINSTQNYCKHKHKKLPMITSFHEVFISQHENGLRTQ